MQLYQLFNSKLPDTPGTWSELDLSQLSFESDQDHARFVVYALGSGQPLRASGVLVVKNESYPERYQRFCLAGHGPLCNVKLAALLKEELGDAVEVLPAIVNGETGLCALNFTVRAGVIDVKRSDLVWSHDKTYIMAMGDLCLKRHSVPKAGAFRLEQHRVAIIVTERIHDLFLKHVPDCVSFEAVELS